MSESHLPDPVRQSLLQDTEVKVSDWVRDAVEGATKITALNYEKTLASKLIQHAYRSAHERNLAVGVTLAAAFDLFIAADYYKSITNKGWYYCPTGEPLLFYPYTNTCPRCVLKGNFHFEKANKPGSGSIGQATSRILGIFLLELFAKAGRDLQVYKGIEPIDMIIVEESTNTVFLSEIKASPLQTLALAVSSDKLTESQGDGEVVYITKHTTADNTSLSSSEIYMCLPLTQNGHINYKLISLGSSNKIEKKSPWAYSRIEQALNSSDTVFDEYLTFWLKAYEVYATYNAQKNGVYWLTNACGQPNSRPADWPKRSNGGGYESVSDGKTSVGMDRTDDIKKGIYQVLKVGAESKLQKKRSQFTILTGLISNIHAVRHYKEYLTPLEGLIWTKDESGLAKKVSDLPPETEVYNLADGIISFTESYIRDSWLKQIFQF